MRLASFHSTAFKSLIPRLSAAIILSSSVFFTAISCGPQVKFLSPQFKSLTREHKMIAVLPARVVMTGKMPKDLTDAQRQALEEAESQAFQTSIYRGLLNRSGSDKKDIYIPIQDVEKTLRVLKANGISIRQSWDKSPEQLAATLGVDAVVVSTIKKTRYMSDLESYGISVAEDIIRVLGDKLPSDITNMPTVGGTISQGAGDRNKTHDIDAECKLLNGKDGTLLWKNAYIGDTDWQQPANEVIDQISFMFGKRFPYRKED